MIKINLLPFRTARNKELINRQIFTFIGTLCIVALLLVAINIWLGGKVKRQQVAVKTIKEEVTKYEAITQEINKIKSQLDLLEKKTAVIDNLEESRREAVHMMETMSDSVVEGRMWLTSLETRVTEQKPPPTKEPQKGTAKTKPEQDQVPLPPIKNVSLQGLALDNKTVADFMTRLEQTKSKTSDETERLLFSRVKLNTLKQHRLDDNLNLKQFNLDLTETLPESSTPSSKASQ